MSIRVGFDVDGVIANFNKAFRQTATEADGVGPHEGGPRPLTAELTKRVWNEIARTPQWWLRLEPFEPEQLARLYEISRSRRWEVYFLTTRPSSAGETTQFQTQWWLESNGFPMPSVVTVPGSRGDAANAIKLDIVVDDRLTNCVDIIAASRAKAILLMRTEDPALRSQASARGIAVVSTLADALSAIDRFEDAKQQAAGGRLARLADWFKPSKPQDEGLPKNVRAIRAGAPGPRNQ